MTSIYDIILAPVVTSKSNEGTPNKKYTFKVLPDANKIQIKAAIEQIYKVKVASVNTVNYDGKLKRMGRNEGRRPAYKKAIVTLTADSKPIAFFDSLS